MTTQHCHKSSACALATLTLLLFNSIGCSDNGPTRIAVWGDVTWKGQTVPSGVVYFGPDTSKGNKGPQGFALIKEGRYDTRYPLSKGCSTGPQIAVVHGCDGQGIGRGSPYGQNLFAPYEMPIDIPAEGGQVDIKIPDSAAPPGAASEPE